MESDDPDHDIHKHELTFETFQPGWDTRNLASVTSEIGHAHHFVDGRGTDVAHPATPEAGKVRGRRAAGS